MNYSEDQAEAISLPAKLSNLGLLKDFITNQLTSAGFSEIRCQQIELACDEFITNIINYAYPECSGDVTVCCKKSGSNEIEIEITDQGIPYNPLTAAEPDLSSGLNERQIGGLGISLARKMADKMTYSRYQNSNILTVLFKENR